MLSVQQIRVKPAAAAVNRLNLRQYVSCGVGGQQHVSFICIGLGIVAVEVALERIAAQCGSQVGIIHRIQRKVRLGYPLAARTVREYAPQLGFVDAAAAAGSLARNRSVADVEVVDLVAIIRRYIQLRGTYITAEIRIAAAQAPRGRQQCSERLLAAHHLRSRQCHITIQ